MKNLLKFILISLLIGGIIITITATISLSNDISDEDSISTDTTNEEDNPISTKEVFIIGRNNNNSLDDDMVDINVEK